MKYRFPENLKLISQEKIKSWRVEDRVKYIDTLLMDFLTVNSDRGLTIDDLRILTKFHRATITSHLEKFVVRGEAYKELRGKRIQIFHTNGHAIGKHETVKGKQRDHYFRLYRLTNNDEGFIYIQERALDDFKRDNVIGVIKIRDDEIKEYIKKLHTFSAMVVNNE